MNAAPTCDLKYRHMRLSMQHTFPALRLSDMVLSHFYTASQAEMMPMCRGGEGGRITSSLSTVVSLRL